MNAIIWSKEQCSNCDQAKNICKIFKIQFEERLIGENWSKEQLLEVVPGAKSVPQIFINNEYVGGLNELKRYVRGIRQ